MFLYAVDKTILTPTRFHSSRSILTMEIFTDRLNILKRAYCLNEIITLTSLSVHDSTLLLMINMVTILENASITCAAYFKCYYAVPVGNFFVVVHIHSTPTSYANIISQLDRSNKSS